MLDTFITIATAYIAVRFGVYYTFGFHELYGQARDRYAVGLSLWGLVLGMVLGLISLIAKLIHYGVF